MTNEAVCIESPTRYARYKVPDNIGIAKGTLLQMSGVELYVLASDASTTGQVFAGVAIEEKTASDGVTEIGAALDGVWDLVQHASTNGVSGGSIVAMSGANFVRLAVEADFPLGTIVGKQLEHSSPSEAARVRVGSII